MCLSVRQTPQTQNRKRTVLGFHQFVGLFQLRRQWSLVSVATVRLVGKLQGEFETTPNSQSSLRDLFIDPLPFALSGRLVQISKTLPCGSKTVLGT
jgi:hypothetical protein